MRIIEIRSQHRRDFTAVYQCEWCRWEHTGSGYDDTNFHVNVIPAMKCGKCHKTAGDDYEPRTPKYPDGMTI